jgi:hypothetical protein
VNSFCAPYGGGGEDAGADDTDAVKLCYDGAVGYQAYGKVGYLRRARVTQARRFGKEIVTWLRRSDGIVVDNDQIYTA